MSTSADLEAVTDTDVFQETHRLFGIGEFYGSQANWFRWRAVEVSKIRATRLKHEVEPFEMFIATRWCKRRHIHIAAYWQLFEHIPAAMREFRDERRAAVAAELEGSIARAIASEAPGSEWFDRLVRATGAARKEVYEEWLAQR